MYPASAPRLELDAQHYTALLDAADVTSLHHDPGELFGALTQRLRRVVPLDLINLAWIDSSRKIMKMYMWEGAEEWPREPQETAVGESAAGSVWRNQTGLCIDDLTTETEFKPGLAWLREREIRSYCVFPLTTFHEKLGALGFGSKRAYGFSSQDFELLHRVAEMAALSVDTTLDEATLAEERARLRLLVEVSAPELQACDLPRFVARILGSMQKWAPNDYVGFYFYDGYSPWLRLHMTDSELAERLAPQGLTPIDGTLAGQALRSRRSVVLDHAGLAGLPFPQCNAEWIWGSEFYI
ncbi:MAG: GAF domain-containing protein [Candidatus Sulfotelmatobacter sp.]